MKPQIIKSETGPAWTGAEKWLFRWVFGFVVLFMLTLPFPHPLIPDLPGLFAPVFERLAAFTGHNIFGISRPFVSRLISDSTGLYLHVFNLLVISIIIAFIWGRADRKTLSYHRLLYWFRVIAAYYLAYFMLVYGFNKVFKWQFYLPEPNTLYTTVGESYRDILYWSTMGTSHSYNVFLGGAELVAALLLFFKRSRLAGALFAAALMLNILMINLSFNINVKLFSSFLLVLCMVLIVPELRRLARFFFQRREQTGRMPWEPVYARKQTKRVYLVVKTILLCWLLASTLFVYVKTGNYNDDLDPRPPFHGAWEVTNFIKNNDTLPPLLTDQTRWKRVFIHRKGYLIIQGMNDGMQDFKLITDTIQKRWLAEDEAGKQHLDIRYEIVSDSLMKLFTIIGGDSIQADIQLMDWRKLPVMKKEFEFSVD